jgi:hypothetical protein
MQQAIGRLLRTASYFMDNQPNIVELMNLRRQLISSLKMVELLLVDSGTLRQVVDRERDELRRETHIVVRVSA